MSRANKYFRTVLDFLLLGTIGMLFILLRYVSRASRVLYSVLPGKEHFYRWSYDNVEYKIHYKVSGPTDAPLLVLFHAPEIGASGYEMRHIMPELAQSYRVYTPDLLGFGLSDHPDIEYTSSLYVALYTDFLQDVVARPAIVVASGLSCKYSVAVAQKSPALCARLIVLSPQTLLAEPARSPWFAPILNTPGAGLLLYAALTLPFLLRLVIAQQHKVAYRQVSDAELDYILTSAIQANSHYAALAFLNGALDMNVATQFERLTQPVLLIQGTSPSSYSGPVLPPLLARSIAQYEQITVVPFTDSGIRVHEERPIKVVSSIMQWQDRPAGDESPSDDTTIVASTVEVPVQYTAESATDEIAFDSSNIVTLNSVDIVSESSIGEASVLQNEAVPDPAVVEATQESERETERMQKIEALIERTEAYCVKCREKREMQNARRIVTKNGRNAMEGTCPVCSTRLFRFIAR